tara:strand:- start:3776 stop:3970 length:195 start_codon:yes stop_codon:yes gene_type:complete
MMNEETLVELNDKLQEARTEIGSLLNESRRLMGTQAISQHGHTAFNKVEYVQDRLIELFGQDHY